MKKQCSRCKEIKPSAEFGKCAVMRSGLRSRCKACECLSTQRSHAKYPDKVVTENRAWRAANPGRGAALSKAWRAAHPERQAASAKAWYVANPDKADAITKAWRALNPGKMAVTLKIWKANNPGKYAQYKQARKSAKLKAVPLWFDKPKADLIYARAAKKTKDSGISHVVDHIVPLQSKLVSGLHWHGNLRVITKSANSKKSNRHWPNMP